MRYFISFLCCVLTIACFAQTIDDSYKNYDFAAGEKTIFKGNIQYDLKDKQNQKWLLDGGAASLISFDGQNCISVDAYYTRLSPILFGSKALPDSISIEYDTWLDEGYDGNPGIEIHFKNGENEVLITPNKHNLSVSFPADGKESKENPEAYFGENKFYNRWVHISIALFKSHLLVYLDQYKMIDIPDCRLKAKTIFVTGNSSQNMRMLLNNFRIATLFPKKLIFQNNRFVTHAIKFDVNKFSIKPESIVIIKEIFNYLTQNKTERFEIGGHTDNDGTESYNLKLSQQRAEAVMNQLVSMGIEKNLLEAKGYGQGKPINNQNTPEAKAANRRVEFTKL
jgi:outer membrane protein OmpA-like peptidoglycan-associated protein